MAIGTKITGLEKLTAKLRDLAAKSRRDDDCQVTVGFTAAYAIYVHENLQMKWRGLPRKSGKGVYWGPHGQAKFLEGPAREMAAELAQIAYVAVAQGKSLSQGLLLAGLRLQREAQQRVPVVTGNLRASAFTRLEPRGGATTA